VGNSSIIGGKGSSLSETKRGDKDLWRQGTLGGARQLRRREKKRVENVLREGGWRTMQHGRVRLRDYCWMVCTAFPAYAALELK
jgi:hypothetical protein